MSSMLRVWAPEAGRVEVEIGRERIAMTRRDDGWWLLRGRQVDPGTDYAFVLDGEGPYPDPRSPRQPRGVHQPSQTIDHARFDWSDAGFRQPPLSNALIYELHVGTFSPEGTFRGVVDRLDHLVDLGVTHVELLPVNGFSGARGWGYDGVSLFAPHEAYGGPEELKLLVDACHRRGLAVLLDVVYNHLGPEGNYLEKFSPHYFTGKYHTPWGKAVNLDGPWSDEARRFFCDNAVMWLRDYHFDGLRIDAVHAFLDTSATHLLEQLANEVELLETELGRPLVLIAESDLNDPRVIRSRELGGYGIHAQWSDDLHHALHAALSGEQKGYYADFGSLRHVAAALEHAFVFTGQRSSHRQRPHGRSPEGLSGHHFLGYLQTHDQVGNRALGDRIGHLVGPQRQKIGAALVLTAPYVPMLFQGEEWAASSPFQYFTDHQDPQLGEAVRRGRRSEFRAFGWRPEQVPDPQDPATFERSKLRWEEIDAEPHGDMLAWYRALIGLRRQQPALRDGRRQAVTVRFDDQDRWLIVERGPVAVCCNLSSQARAIAGPRAAPRTLRMASEAGVEIGAETITLPPESVAIFAPEA